MMQVTVVDHPLIKQKITKMRAEHTSSRDFRECLDEIAMLMTYEVARNLPLQEVEVATPVAKTTGYKVAGDIFVVPILRAGLGLLTGVLKMIPDARVGFIGLYRDEETLKPIEYYCLVAAPEGVKVMNDEHPDVPVYTAALDEKLNEHGYIVPGLGDAGDRIFGTH